MIKLGSRKLHHCFAFTGQQERGHGPGWDGGLKPLLEDSSSTASCQDGLRGAKELGKETAWLLSQRHGGDTALQSVSIVTNWHFPMEKKKIKNAWKQFLSECCQHPLESAVFLGSRSLSQVSKIKFQSPASGSPFLAHLGCSSAFHQTGRQQISWPPCHPLLRWVVTHWASSICLSSGLGQMQGLEILLLEILSPGGFYIFPVLFVVVQMPEK